MQISVDMTRCQSYGQCCFLAPDVFRFDGEQALVHDPGPDDAHRQKILESAAACPVQAIRLDHRDSPARHRPGSPSAHPWTAAAGASRIRDDERIVIVGASLAGLCAAEEIRRRGFRGALTIVGAEPVAPYDRPALSKQVLTGHTSATRTTLPQEVAVEAEWRLGARATGLDLEARDVALADGTLVPFDRLVIATGVRARGWDDAGDGADALPGVLTLRTAEDAALLRARLEERPRRVLVIGGGVLGTEIASSCRSLDVPVTLVHRGAAPLAGSVGEMVGGVLAQLQRESGVDLRCGTGVASLEHDVDGALRGAVLTCGEEIDAELAVVATGSIPHTEWLEGTALAVRPRGLVCDSACRVLDREGRVVQGVYAAGDVTLSPDPLDPSARIAVQHWGEAVAQARVAAHNLVSGEDRAHDEPPMFWSSQFGRILRAVGSPGEADAVEVVQGTLESRAFVAAYGRRGRLVGAVSLDHSSWLPHYRDEIARGAAFPPVAAAIDSPSDAL